MKMKLLSTMVIPLALVSVRAAAATLATPRLQARVDPDGSVRLRCTTQARRSTSVLELERRPDAGTFAQVASIPRPRRRQSYDDRPGAPGVYVYQARIVGDAGTSPWSDPVSVDTRTVINPGPGTDPGSGPPLPAGMIECPANFLGDTLVLINRVRGGQPLVDNARLDEAARVHTIFMAANSTLTHENAFQEMQDAGYVVQTTWGQNAAWGYGSPAQVTDGWAHSAPHLRNIQDQRYRDSGLGCVIDHRGVVWWTQDFGG
jgi:hypothetical protein